MSNFNIQKVKIMKRLYVNFEISVQAFSFLFFTFENLNKKNVLK